jgi:hypothetical protein
LEKIGTRCDVTCDALRFNEEKGRGGEDVRRDRKKTM